MEKQIGDILKEDERRLAVVNAPFNPVTGEGSIGERVKLEIPDFPLPSQWLPKAMLKVPLVKELKRAGSLTLYVLQTCGPDATEAERQQVINAYIHLRCRYDFPFWAAMYVYIKNKGGGSDVPFWLTIAQRKIISLFEEQRLAGKPIRVILVKARQLGGSTAIQIYMSWLQLVHRTGLNSLIISLQNKASDEIYNMFVRMIKAYPVEMLHGINEKWSPGEDKFVGVGTSGAIHRVPQRNCNIKLGSAEKPDSCRGGDYSLVHLSEVGLWKTTEGKSPEDIVQSACSGILLKPYTMIVYESTAKGTGNFFHREYTAAKEGRSQFTALCIRWFEIPQWSMPFGSEQEREEFAASLWHGREVSEAPNEREEPGRYLWWVWNQGATLEALHWYVEERRGRSGHTKMSSEYPSDDVEAFSDIDSAWFDRYEVERLKPACRAPRWVGEVYADGVDGADALSNVRFKEDSTGSLWVWNKPDIDEDEKVTERYVVSVDIGGRTGKSDWSVICVFDRMAMIDGGKPAVVAQWYGHCDIDLLSWKAAQIAQWYDEALLVIEKNTIDTHQRQSYYDTDQSGYVLDLIKDVYPNLYARRESPDDIAEGRPRKYGFHTNVFTKPIIVNNLQAIVRDQLYVERDERCLHEYLVYEQKPNGSWGAVEGDHDDLVMTRAIGLYIAAKEMGVPKIVKRQHKLISKFKAPVSAATI